MRGKMLELDALLTLRVAFSNNKLNSHRKLYIRQIMGVFIYPVLKHKQYLGTAPIRNFSVLYLQSIPSVYMITPSSCILYCRAIFLVVRVSTRDFVIGTPLPSP